MKKLPGILILIAVAVMLSLLFVLRNNLQAVSELDSLVFKRNCGKCHSVERPLGIEKTSIGWQKTVDWMQKKKNSFSDSEVKIIKRYLIKTHDYYPKIIFEKKCSKCHSLNVALEQEHTPQEWNNLVSRERQKAIAWISLDEVHDIAMYLATNRGHTAGLNKIMAEKKELTEKKCLMCHLYSSVFGVKRTQQQWRIIIKRMSYKCPQWINQEQSEEIIDFLFGL